MDNRSSSLAGGKDKEYNVCLCKATQTAGSPMGRCRCLDTVRRHRRRPRHLLPVPRQQCVVAQLPESKMFKGNAAHVRERRLKTTAGRDTRADAPRLDLVADQERDAQEQADGADNYVGDAQERVLAAQPRRCREDHRLGAAKRHDVVPWKRAAASKRACVLGRERSPAVPVCAQVAVRERTSICQVPASRLGVIERP